MDTPPLPHGNGLTPPIDQAQFNQLYEQTFDAVHTRLLAEVHNSQRAEDLTVAVYVEAWNKRDQLNGTIDVLSWLLMMASVVVIADPVDGVLGHSDLLPEAP